MTKKELDDLEASKAMLNEALAAGLAEPQATTARQTLRSLE